LSSEIVAHLGFYAAEISSLLLVANYQSTLRKIP